MSEIAAILKKAHASVHYFEDVKPKKKYSTGLYTGGIKVSQWSKLKKSVQEEALKKNWYLWWSYRNPETGKIERQDNIKAGVNWYKTKEERLEILKTLQRNLERLLREGYNPHHGDSGIDIGEIPSVQEAIAYGMQIKEKTLGEISYKNLRSRIKRFEQYLVKNGYGNRFITSVDKNIVNRYLKHVLEASSARNRNNTRADLSSLFQSLEDNDIIPFNFISKIPILKSKPKRNKSYTHTQVDSIYDYLQKENPQLLLFIKFVSYNEINGKYLQGEHSHGGRGILEGYQEILEIKNELLILKTLKERIEGKRIRINDSCYCGSGKPLKKCKKHESNYRYFRHINKEILKSDLLKIVWLLKIEMECVKLENYIFDQLFSLSLLTKK